MPGVDRNPHVSTEEVDLAIKQALLMLVIPDLAWDSFCIWFFFFLPFFFPFFFFPGEFYGHKIHA